ncbi:MAG TPA: PAS domain S-box protein [Stellaceae bacterium]|nr:PAS domain S-box protein [Stellaceae bacterium]
MRHPAIAAAARVPIIPALFLLDAHGAVTGWNAAAQEYCGYPAGGLRGLPFDRLFTPQMARGGNADWLGGAASAGRVTIEAWLTRKDGSRTSANVTIEKLIADPAAAFAVAVNEPGAVPPNGDALAGSESQFRMLVQGVTDYAIYMLDPLGNVANWNLGGERITGYREEEVIGRHFSRFYTEEDRVKGEPERALVIAARSGRYETEGWRLRKDGTRFWANAGIDAIRDVRGTLIGFAKVTRDLTEKKEVEEALEQARAALAQSQKMEAVGQLTGGVAHDFNNLLTVVTSALDLLAGAPRDDVHRRRIIESAQRAADRGARLTQQLLAFSRRQPLRPEIHNLNSLIRGFEAVLRRACPEPIEFAVNLSAMPLSANVDAAQFETALLNLVVNARDAMPRGGTLRIETGVETIGSARAKAMGDMAPGDYVAVRVGDNGVGMPPRVAARAFEPFFTTKEVGKGSGLGLSQVYGFVVQSDGHVAIDSKPGSGTTVTFYLPVAASPAASARGTAATLAGDRAMGRVLVVEDDPEVLEVTVETVRRMGYEVLTASDGPAALAILRRETSIDILFSDIVMPRGMNGVELARAASRLRPQLRVLLVSGYPAPALKIAPGRYTGTAPGTAPASETDGEFAFLSKPYCGADLAEALRALQPA